MSMEQAVNDLTTAVTELGTVIEAAIALLGALVAGQGNPVPVEATTAQVKAMRDALMTAVLAATPRDPTLPPVAP